jgi:hypothetical protein
MTKKISSIHDNVLQKQIFMKFTPGEHKDLIINFTILNYFAKEQIISSTVISQTGTGSTAADAAMLQGAEEYYRYITLLSTNRYRTHVNRHLWRYRVPFFW